MKKQSLNGVWSYRVGCGEWVEKEVPFSELAVGHSECKKIFDIEYRADRVELKFDGITYNAKVFLNGELLGEMLPYSEYTFDIKDKVKPSGNEIRVELEDIDAAFGPVAGWENFGGIIRDVYLLYSANERITDAFFYSELQNDYRDAVCHIDIKGEKLSDCTYEISLSQNGSCVIKEETNAENKIFDFFLKDAKLWSPETPNLYKMQIKLIKNAKILDIYTHNVGIREIKCDRHRFLINGKHLFLRGVCKHEMVGSSGHCVSPSLIKRDMEDIKSLGCNFVRLVHYPHSKITLDIADELGLMVSEEPGLWWSDTSDKRIAEGSIEVLRRTIMRDRNHPSVAFWLSFNECQFTEEFLVESAKMCKATDPTRLVSGANCMSDEDTLKYYNICGFDFYTMHPYSETFARSMRSAKMLTDKPLVFTEWGGHFVYDNLKVMREFIYEMRKLYEKNSDDGALAGAFIWCYAEINDFNREWPASVDGRLLEGLVDYERNPRMCYSVFKNAWEEDMNPVKYSDRLLCQISENVSAFKYASGAISYDEVHSKLFDKPKPPFLTEQRPRMIKVGPVCENPPYPYIRKKPYVLSGTIEFSYSGDCGGVIVLGGTDITAGYPICGKIGETVANLVVTTESGEELVYPLRRGIELTSAFATYKSSRINPIASEAPRFMEFSYNGSYERYVMNKIQIKFDKCERVKTCRLISLDDKSLILVYAVLAIKN